MATASVPHRWAPGQQYGRWTILEKVDKDRVRCRCECGTIRVVRTVNLGTGSSRSCGCMFAGHGWSQTEEYNIWAHMKHRCSSPKDPSYQWYGGRGITVCARWQQSFMAFLTDMGPRPSPAHSVDRINNDGNYEPGNCRWATIFEQRANQRSKGRRAHCPHGHAYTPENTVWRIKRGIRYQRCRACDIESGRRRRAAAQCRPLPPQSFEL